MIADTHRRRARGLAAAVPKLLLALLLLAVLLWVAPAAAQEAAAAPPQESAPSATEPTAADAPSPLAPASFLVERIVVEGVKSATGQAVVRDESLLVEGNSYGERELREAVYRIRRLPFVVEADMALRRGSERGAYELVVTVTVAKPIAYQAEGYAFAAADDPRDPDDEGWEFGAAGTLSARKFVGRRGMLFGSVQGYSFAGAGELVQLGYTQYGVLRPGGFLTGWVASRVGGDDDSNWLETALEAGVPLVGNHALRGTATWSRNEHGGDFPNEWEATLAELEWVYDTTDDPIVPLEGTRVTTRVGYSLFEQTYMPFTFPGEPPAAGRVTDDRTTTTLRSEGRHYHRMTPRQALGATLAYWYTRDESDYGEPLSGISSRTNVETLAVVEIVHAASLLDFERTRRVGDLRLETAVAVEWFDEDDDSEFGERQQETRVLLRSTLTFRHAWGLVRFSLSYAGGDR